MEAPIVEMVTTISKSEVPKSECRYIKGEYYKIGDVKVEHSGDCYLINGRYFRVETGRLVYDHEIKEYVLNNDSLIVGVVGIVDSTFVMGSFTKNAFKNVSINCKTSGRTYLLVNEEVVRNNRSFRYHMNNDQYYHISSVKAKEFSKIRPVDEGYKRSLEYDCRDILDRYTAEYDKNDSLPITMGLEQMAETLKGLTFGAEFETVIGNVPQRYTGPLGLIPLRDGSVAGLEYATIPLSGAKGLSALIKTSEVLDKFTKYDKNCSLHLHIGNVPRTKEFFLALFKTLSLLQDSMFEMFPIYKKYNFGVKRKNYTKPFPTTNLLASMDSEITKDNIDSNFNVLYQFLSMGQSFSEVGNDLANVKHHPSDPRGKSKWNIKSRYYWVNFIPLLFGNKQTVEFRIHTPTTDKDKVLAYLFTCCGIINFVKDNTEAIIRGKALNNITIYDIMHTVYDGLPTGFSSTLVNYLANRRRLTAFDNAQGNIIGNEDAIKPSGFKWSYNEEDIELISHQHRLRGLYRQPVQMWGMDE